MTRSTRLLVHVLAIVTLVIALTAGPATAREEILSFDSTVEVQANGTLMVEETIRVRAEGRSIRRGIYRDFPIRYREPAGTWRYVGFDLTGILRDGKDEPYHTEYIGNAKRIYVGDADVFLRSGEYTYTIRYRTTRQLRYFDNYDELYWNVTGNFWSFPIKQARATITLPEGATLMQRAGYTGTQGSTSTDYTVTGETERTITFEATRNLRAYEGLTIAIAFPKGVVWQPSALTKGWWHLWDNIGLAILFTGALTVAVYFYGTWRRIGRDPRRGVVIPLFAPPAGFSPAAVSYLHHWGLKGASSGTPLAFIAALMSLAVKRRIRIIEEDGDDTIAVARMDAGTEALPPGEKALESALLGGRERIEFTQANSKVVVGARSRFISAIKREYSDKFFRNNRGAFALGAVMSGVTILAFVGLHRPTDEQALLLFPTFISALLGTSLLFFGLGWLFRWMPDGKPRWLGALMVPIGAIALVPALLLPLASFGQIPAFATIAFAALPAMNVVFFHLLRAPTLIGRKVMDQIEGFKLYLTTAEAERLNLQDAPDMSTELFETYLPYAVALGVEKPWSKAFAAHLARTIPDQAAHAGYYPAWYSGRSWDSSRVDRATANLAAAISSGVAASMPQSSSSSGSSGGGFSGGGGGGGGGGGW